MTPAARDDHDPGGTDETCFSGGSDAVEATATVTAAEALAARVEAVEARAYTIPTNGPEADGTLSWSSTTLVVVHVRAAGVCGLGYTYADASAASLITRVLAPVVHGTDVGATRATWLEMARQVRNLGRPGVASMAISAVDQALWDLHARLLDVPLAGLLGAARASVPVYGSGGFTAYDDERLVRQMSRWVDAGIPRVKMKIGGDADEAVRRAALVREAIGGEPELFVDANGAYAPRPAVAAAERLVTEAGASWFEEPVSADDLVGLRFVRERAPASIEIAAGEYGYDPTDFHRWLASESVDVLQADVTRCGGITGLLLVDALCQAAHRPLSLHCGPAAHVHPGCALLSLRHLEYFHDHERIEGMFFGGLPELSRGELWPDLERPGNGLIFNADAAAEYAVEG